MNAVVSALGWNQIESYHLAGRRWALFFIGFTSFAVIAPYLCHQFGGAGTVLLPMHFAVLFAAMVMGIRGGVLTAVVSPTLSHILSGMPPTAMLTSMTIELSVYAIVAGWFVHRIHSRILTGLLIAMIAGRVAAFLLYVVGVNHTPSVSLLMKNLFIVSIPGIVVQIILLPIAVSKIGAHLKKVES